MSIFDRLIRRRETVPKEPGFFDRLSPERQAELLTQLKGIVNAVHNIRGMFSPEEKAELGKLFEKLGSSMAGMAIKLQATGDGAELADYIKKAAGDSPFLIEVWRVIKGDTHELKEVTDGRET